MRNRRLKCQEAQKLLHAYADGELDLVTSLEVEEHFNECSECAQTHQSIQKLRSYVKERSTYFETPARLQTRLRAAIGAKAVGSKRRSTPWRCGQTIAPRSRLPGVTSPKITDFTTATRCGLGAGYDKNYQAGCEVNLGQHTKQGHPFAKFSV